MFSLTFGPLANYLKDQYGAMSGTASTVLSTKSYLEYAINEKIMI